MTIEQGTKTNENSMKHQKHNPKTKDTRVYGGDMNDENTNMAEIAKQRT